MADRLQQLIDQARATLEDARELVADIRDHWDDDYWWQRHLELRIALLSIISGLIGLLFKWLEQRIPKPRGAQ